MSDFFFLVKIEKCSIVHTFCILFSYSFISVPLDCFQLLVIVNNFVKDTEVQTSLCISAFTSLVYTQRCNCWTTVILLLYYLFIYLFILRNHHGVFHSSCTIFCSYQQYTRVTNFAHCY